MFRSTNSVVVSSFASSENKQTTDPMLAVQPSSSQLWYRSVSRSFVIRSCELIVVCLFLLVNLLNNSFNVDRNLTAASCDSCICQPRVLSLPQALNSTSKNISTQPAAIGVDEHAVFYHAFIDAERAEFSHGIITEQLSQLQKSSLVKSTLYYGLVGNSSQTFRCPANTTCSMLFHQNEGWEVNTLQKLFEYCLVNRSHRVVYLHNKGSYHDNERNHQLRRALTRSAISDECSSGLDSGCDVCSARFSPLPRWHVTGNMWTATCAHITRLIAPISFESSVKKFVQIYSDREQNGTLPPDHWVGVARFADEHWVHTFTRIKPCDVITDPQLTWGYPLLNESSTLELQAAPRWPLDRFKEGMDPLNKFFRVKYRLAELQYLYNEVPPSDHFIWKQYIEGDMV